MFEHTMYLLLTLPEEPEKHSFLENTTQGPFSKFIEKWTLGSKFKYIFEIIFDILSFSKNACASIVLFKPNSFMHNVPK